MYIDPKTGAIWLDEGEAYIREEALENGNRLATLTLCNGMEIQVLRSYAHIRPPVYDAEGNELKIELDRASGTLLPQGTIDFNYADPILATRLRLKASKMQTLARELTIKAQNLMIKKARSSE